MRREESEQDVGDDRHQRELDDAEADRLGRTQAAWVPRKASGSPASEGKAMTDGRGQGDDSAREPGGKSSTTATAGAAATRAWSQQAWTANRARSVRALTVSLQ